MCGSLGQPMAKLENISFNYSISVAQEHHRHLTASIRSQPKLINLTLILETILKGRPVQLHMHELSNQPIK